MTTHVPILFCGFYRQFSSQRMVHGVVKMGGHSQKIRRTISLYLRRRSAFSTAGSFAPEQKKKTNPKGPPRHIETLVATIHSSRFTGEWFTDFLFIHGLFPQPEGSFCPFTSSLVNHGRTLHTFTPFTRIRSIHANSLIEKPLIRH